MIRETLNVRPDWQQKCEDVGFHFHTIDGLKYWDEEHCYQFTSDEIDKIDDVTTELHQMAIAATADIITKGDYTKYLIPEEFASDIESSWKRKDRGLYGRMDLAWNGIGEPKLLEYNADTPTSLLEASIAQWDWVVDTKLGDQFNSLHEKLVTRWKQFGAHQLIHFACQRDMLEDINTTEYLFRTAEEANIDARWILMDDIGWDGREFLDLDMETITKLFKLYPTEWLLDEEFARNIQPSGLKLIEPTWKVITSSKAILVKMWEMNKDHPNLLPSYFAADKIGTDYVRKPIFSREGANIQSNVGGVIEETSGEYGKTYMFQKYHELPKFDDRYTLIGSWVIGDEAAGIGMREDSTAITRNTSCFVPHYFN